MPALPRPLSSEVIKGEQFVLTDLLKSLPGGSSQAEAILEPLVRLDYLPLVMHDPKPAPQVVSKKKKKSRKAKAAGEGQEGFMDWTNPTVSKSTEEREVEMSGLIAKFSIRMHKRATNAQERTTLGLEVPSDKRSRPSRSNEEVQDDPMVIVWTRQNESLWPHLLLRVSSRMPLEILVQR